MGRCRPWVSTSSSGGETATASHSKDSLALGIPRPVKTLLGGLSRLDVFVYFTLLKTLMQTSHIYILEDLINNNMRKNEREEAILILFKSNLTNI